MENSNALVKELATRVNKLVNIPLVNEANEQVFFEMVVGILMDILFREIDMQA